MEPKDDPSMIETKEFLDKLDQLNTRLTRSADERHQTNGLIHKALIGLEHNQEKLALVTKSQDGVLEGLQRSVTQLTELMRRIEIRFIGDPNLGSTGLSQTVAEHSTELGKHDERLESLENTASFNSKLVVIGMTTAGAMGGVVMWVKGSGVIKWLTGP